MKTTTEIILIYAREHGWEKTRKVVYGDGIVGKDVFRDSAEGTAMGLFVNSRMFKDDIINKLTK